MIVMGVKVNKFQVLQVAVILLMNQIQAQSPSFHLTINKKVALHELPFIGEVTCYTLLVFFLIKFFKYVPQCFVSLLLNDANWFAIHIQILL